MTTTEIVKPNGNETASTDFDNFVELVKRTCKEKTAGKDVQALRVALNAHPEYWKTVGHLARNVQESLIQRVGPVPMQESLRVGIQVLEKELCHEEASLLERLLIREVLICWLDLYNVRETFICKTTGRHSVAHGKYWDSRVSAAQRRYIRAIESLARVRKLANRQPLQINIANQQVNVAG